MADWTEPKAPHEEGLTADDRHRANRIGFVTLRLARLEALLQWASEGAGRTLTLSIHNVPSAHPVNLRGVKAERLLGHLIDQTSGELQALL